MGLSKFGAILRSASHDAGGRMVKIAFRIRGVALAVLYDEDCGVCVRTAAWISRHDRQGRMACLPALGEERRRRFPGLDETALLEALHVVDGEGRVFKGHEGFREILKRLPGYAPLAGLWRIPGVPWVADKVYRQVAARRPRECRVKAS